MTHSIVNTLFRNRISRTLTVLSWGLLAGCEPQVALQGLVTDTADAYLPGVSVKVKGTETFAITNGNGLFGKGTGRLAVPPGTWELQYIKTGFTTAEQVISTGDGRSFDVPTVMLWPLPNARGIYEWSNHRYTEWTRVEPERHLRADRTVVFGTRQYPELKLEASPERILGHKVSPYDWRLSRLEEVSVLRDEESEADGAIETILTESVRIPVQAVPLDEPEQVLWEIRPTRVLGPGIYAIHWGAFEGDPITSSSAYLVEVVDPVVVMEEEVSLETVDVPKEN